MSENFVLGQNVDFRIEVEDKPQSVLLVMDRKADTHVVTWESAFRLAEVMEQVINDLRGEFKPTSFFVTQQEQTQVKLNHHKGLVAILCDWTDRIRFTSLDAFFLVARALRKMAQDAYLELRGTKIEYNTEGLIKKIHNFKAGFTQEVR